MQNCVVLAFRKRLKKRGYTEVSIVQLKDPITGRFAGKYLVCAVEPLSGLPVKRECTFEYMQCAFRF